MLKNSSYPIKELGMRIWFLLCLISKLLSNISQYTSFLSLRFARIEGVQWASLSLLLLVGMDAASIFCLGGHRYELKAGMVSGRLGWTYGCFLFCRGRAWEELVFVMAWSPATYVVSSRPSPYVYLPIALVGGLGSLCGSLAR